MVYDHAATCRECNGEGCVEHPHVQTCASSHAESPPDPAMVDCEHCNGAGECACDDCVDTASENAFSAMCEGEPPISAQERYEAAGRQKRELSR